MKLPLIMLHVFISESLFRHLNSAIMQWLSIFISLACNFLIQECQAVSGPEFIFHVSKFRT